MLGIQWGTGKTAEEEQEERTEKNFFSRLDSSFQKLIVSLTESGVDLADFMEQRGTRHLFREKMGFGGSCGEKFVKTLRRIVTEPPFSQELPAKRIRSARIYLAITPVPLR